MLMNCREEWVWVRLNGVPSEQMPYALCTDIEFPDQLWAGLEDGTVWHSEDRGDTWKRLSSSLPEIERSMVML